ncbi:hypothetical protein VTO42DRAFT_2046 [Malbranchea cinnamomea]
MPPPAPPKGSHQRQVSAGSVVDKRPASPAKISSRDSKFDSAGSRSPRFLSSGLNDQLCSLWVHDENFSREEVLFNPHAFGDTGVQAGDLLEISPLPDDLRESGGRTGRDGLGSEPKRPFAGSIRSNSTAASDGKAEQGKFLFLVKPLPPELKSRHPDLQVSVTSTIANIFGFKNRSQVLLTLIERSQRSSSHVELIFRDQFLLRSDMWRLAMSELAGKPVYKGQKILFLGTIKATVKAIYVGGRKSSSGYFSPSTIPIFRSESGRFVLFIQMSKEMWDFDSEGTGDILFSRVINGFLPELFKRWASMDAHHLVTIVLFTRVQYDRSPADSALTALNNRTLNRLLDASTPETQDFYRVVVNDMPSGQWTTILDELKREFRIFLRDVLIPPIRFPQSPTSAEDVPRFSDDCPPTIAGHPTSASRGNILEAINMAASYLSYEHVGRDLLRTGTSIVVITPGTGVFEVPFDALALTSEVLTSRAIAIDLICLSPMPLHSVPLFKYQIPNNGQSRPSSAVSKETVIRASSPETHGISSSISTAHSLAASYESTADLQSRFIRKIRAAQADEWGYGIPHWIDISFWDPHLYRGTETALEKLTKQPIPDTLVRQSQPFVPKVRMYEIQMMGVMESEQSNITIPYLPPVRATLQDTPTAMLLNRGLLDHDRPGGTHLSPPSLIHKSQLLSPTNRPESFMMSLKESKKNLLSPPAKQRTEALEWMDTYDQSVFHAFPKPNNARRHFKAKRATFTEMTDSRHSERPRSTVSYQDSRIAESSSSLYDGHLAEHAGTDKASSPKAGPASPVKSVRKSIIKSTPRLSAPKISRTISFALRGLGPVPRAVPSTEIHVEHAKGVPTTSGKASDDAKTQASSADSAFDHKTIVSPSTIPSKREQANAATMPKNTEKMTPSRPISIKAKSTDDGGLESRTIESSFSTVTEIPHRPGLTYAHRSSFALKGRSTKLDLKPHSIGPDLATKPSSEKILAPWIMPVTPWNPPKYGPTRSSWFGRWQHVYPRMPTTSSVKWKSLKSPAALPITTEEFPSESELATDYLQTPYRVYPNDESDTHETTKSREVLLREMISLRLACGFQIVVGKRVEEEYGLGKINIYDVASLAVDGTTIFMSLGNTIHRLVCVAGGEIEVTKFVRKQFGGHFSDAKDRATSYTPAVKTILSSQYCKNTVRLALPQEEYNWSYADSLLGGHRDHSTNIPRQLSFWRARFVLIPVQIPTNARRPIPSYNEDNEEEVHLLGIYQLTQMWQKHRYIPPEERRFQSLAHKKREQNPLNILYQTSDPSVVVAAELDRLLLDDPGLDNPPAQLLPESELFERSSISMSSLAQAIQGEKGVRMMDRRWHWRLHYNCFVGLELTTWLVQNFRDIDTREEAVAFGNELMKLGLFHHVQRRHNFRDGNYFYQIADEYRMARPESRSGWFQPRKNDKSIPNTPIGEGIREPSSNSHARLDTVTDEGAGESISEAPSKSGRKVTISLSKSMKYDLDPRKRSNRPEIMELHYDRLHNPENCFHIELSWMNTTPKLIEDTLMSWAATAEKYGLKLVELPISEASSITETQIFRRPYPVKLKRRPPDPPPSTAFSSTSFSSQGGVDRLYYHKAILKKFDFVLDFESRSAFPPDVEVLYSWGKADYRYPQYVHRTGMVLAQITDEGHFLLLTNRLYSKHFPATGKESGKFERSEYGRPRAHTLDHSSPRLSPLVRASSEAAPQTSPSQTHSEQPHPYRQTSKIKDELEAFCGDEKTLEQFFAEVTAKAHARPTSTKVGPTVPSTMDASIPALELPASVVPRPGPLPLTPQKTDASPTKAPGFIEATATQVSGKESPKGGFLRLSPS